VSVATPLLTRDALALARAVRPPWQRRLLGAAIPLAVLAVLVVHTVAVPAPPCTDQAPCAPAAWDYLAMGLLLAVAWAGPFDAMAAGWLGVAFLAVLVPAERVVGAALVSPLWTYMVDAGLIAFCFALARVDRWRGTSGALAWTATTHHQPLPAVTAIFARSTPVVGQRRRWLGAALVAAALLLSGMVLWQQDRGETRQAAAHRAAGVVVGHGDDGLTITVRLDGRSDEVALPVLDADQHPAGQRLRVYVDDAGLVQLVSEPYDVTPWLALTVMLVGGGWALWRRESRSVADRAAFLAAPAAPAMAVYVRFGEDVAAVYAADARPGDPAVLVLHGPMPGPEDGPGGVPERDADGLRPVVAGVLYGPPVPGAWCVADADGEVVVPSRPATAGAGAPGFTEPAWGPVWDVGPGDGSSGPAHVAAARDAAPADRDLTVAHTHQLGAGWAAVQAAATPLVLVAVAPWLQLSYVVWLGLVAALLGPAIALLARFVLPARIAWNSAGLAYALGQRLQVRVGWGEVDRIEVHGMAVSIHIDELGLALIAPNRRWLTGSRDAVQLAAALRYARAHALDRAPAREEDLPEVPPRAYSPLPWLALALYAPLLAWALRFLSGLI
jgi:hypothetical protein